MKILLVDDSKSARYALRLQLQRYGITVETSDAAEPALERVREDPPDAIFMDHTMPGMNGFEALDILRTTPATAHIPVVMCTANEDPDFMAQAQKRGAYGVLAKATAGHKLQELLEGLTQMTAAPEEAAAGVSVPRPPAAAGAIDLQQIDERIRALVGPLVEEHAKRMADDLLGRIDERIEARVRSSIEPHMDDLGESLTKDLLAKTDDRMAAVLEKEADRLQKHFLKVQNEHAQLTTNRLLNESLPQLLRQQFKQEKQELAQGIQERIDKSLKKLLEDQDFLRGVAEAVEASLSGSAERIAKRHATEIAETIARQQAASVAEQLMQSSSGGKGLMFVLALIAALVGGGVSAAAVYFLLAGNLA